MIYIFFKLCTLILGNKINPDYQVNRSTELDIMMMFGAGASSPSGIPTIDEMTSEFLEEYQKKECHLF